MPQRQLTSSPRNGTKAGAGWQGKRWFRGWSRRLPDYDEKAGCEIAGFVGFRGCNGMFDVNGRQAYGQNLVHLIKDLRKEFRAPEMDVVFGVIGVNGPAAPENP